MTEFYHWQDDISDHEGGSCLVRIANEGRDEAWLLDATFPGDAEAEEAKALILAALEQADAMRAALAAGLPEEATTTALPTKVTVPLHWYVLIDPVWYDDDEDRGYAWSGEAPDEAAAIARAVTACDDDNDRDEPTDPDHVGVWDCHPDPGKNIVAVANAYDELLNAHEIAPAGHDYNELRRLIAQAADAQAAITVELDTSPNAR